MLTDKYIEKLLDIYFKGELSQEEKDKLFESLRSNPSLNETVQFVLSHTDPSKAELFLSEKSLMCDTQLISEEDETMIELYLSGMMSQEEEADFMDKLVSDADFRTNVLAQAFLVKAIQKIHNADNKILDAAKQTTVSDVKALFRELQDEDDDRLIDSYLVGSLSEDEMKSFEERLKSDNDFRERVSAIIFLSKGIKELQERDAKAIEDAKKISKEDVISTIKEIEKREQRPAAASTEQPAAASIIPLWVKRVAAAAAVALIVVGVGFDYHNYSVMMSNAGECIEFASTQLPHDIPPSRSDGKDLHELFKNVQLKKDLKETIDELEGYYSTDSYLDQVRLALATAYIYDGQKSKAKDMLNEIIKDSEVSPDIKEKAKQLLESIKKTFIF
jgi:FimV-like protein